MRDTKRVSLWPVGLSGGLNLEGPTCDAGKVTGWNAVWDKSRTFAIDMAGTVHSCYHPPCQQYDELWNWKVSIAWDVIMGYLATATALHVNCLHRCHGRTIVDVCSTYPMHTAGFAVNLNLLLSKPSARFDPYSKQGHLESSLLRYLVNITDLEAKAEDCSQASGRLMKSLCTY